MGTRIDAPLRLAQQQAIDDENYISKLAGSRAGPRTPQRHRGIWSFLVAPFVFSAAIAMNAVTARSHSGHGDDEQNDAANDHAGPGNDAALTSSDGHADAVRQAPEENGADQNGSSGSSVATTHAADVAATEDSKKPDITHTADATPNIAMPDGGGGGGGGEDGGGSDDGRDQLGGQNDLNDVLAGNVGSHEGSSATIWSALSQATVHPIVLDASPTSLNLSVGGDLVHATILPALDVGVSLNLKDVIGFDVHLNDDGHFVSADLHNALDLHLPVAQAVDTAIAVADDLPLINLPTLNVLDDLFGAAHHSSTIGPAINPATIIDIQSPIADLGKLDIKDLSLSTKLAGTLSNVDATVSSSGPSALLHLSDTSGHAQSGLTVDPTVVAPGLSIELPAPIPVSGDQLFNGSHYTDYHVALQSTGPSPGSIETAAPLTSVNDAVHTAASPLLEQPATTSGGSDSHAATPPATPHTDLPVTHLGTLDELTRHI